MSNEFPYITHRMAQLYVGIPQTVTMAGLPGAADRIPELLEWLAAQGATAAGPPFFRYNLIDMDADLEVEVGVPVGQVVHGHGPVREGVLPAGRYVTVTHMGAPDTLVGAVRNLLDWASKEGLTWDRVDTRHGERWGCRLESYLTDPRVEPDMTRWKTELAIRLAD
jgi:effector-binding domain-containing protein